MKKDQYFPHEVNVRQTNQMIHLIEEQGMTGYGIYWGLMEYLRSQDNYTGDYRVLKPLASQLKTTVSKLLKVLKGYDLFELSDFTFRSNKLDEMMRPLERKRLNISRESAESTKRVDQKSMDNSLKINPTSVTVKKSKEKKSKVEKRKVTSSTEEAAEAAALLPEKESWETYVDELDGEAQWKELMAMRSGLKMQFYPLYPRIVEAFKNHVRILGNERHIVSLSEAKRYFCFFLTQGSTTFNRLMDELKRKDGKDPFRFEYRDKETGQRMYCGLPIPEDAPPRPCDQAVWNPASKKWFY